MKKIVVVWVVCVLALVGLFAWLGTGLLPSPTPKEQSNTLINGRFSLEDAGGKIVTNASFADHYLLVFFGYTHCPDVCPTTLLTFQKTIDHLGKRAEKLQPLFITVDPERDTPKVVGDYVKHFGDKIVGLSGSAEQIKQTADHFRVYYSKIMNDDPAMGYMMDHSAFIYLIDPQGNYVVHFSADSSAQTLEDGIKKYID